MNDGNTRARIVAGLRDDIRDLHRRALRARRQSQAAAQRGDITRARSLSRRADHLTAKAATRRSLVKRVMAG